MRQPTIDSSDEDNPVKNPVRSIPPGYYRYIEYRQLDGNKNGKKYWKGKTIIGAFTQVLFLTKKEK